MSTITPNNLEGHRALVTGATSGIGRPVALLLARYGAEVLVHGVRVNAIAPGPVYTPTPSGPEFIRALGETTPMHCASATRGDRRGDRVPGLPASELHHRHDRRRRRRTQSDLTSASSKDMGARFR